MKKIILGLIFSGLISFNALAQSFTATVNRNRLPEGETFVLTLDLQDVDTSASPDLSVFSDDFTVFSISNGYRTHITNGNVSKSRQWNLVLMPNKSGQLVIPEIEVGGYKTQAITMDVIPAGSEDKVVQSAPQAAPQFKMSGQVSNTNPYVQQQINYRLKIYDAGGLQGEAPVFVTNGDDWIIKSLGAPKVETKIVNGRTLREITFDYALFAQKSGALTVPAVKFNGYYLTKSTRTDPFARFFDDDEFFAGFGLHDVFANKTPVSLTAKPIAVDVRPAPADAGWWLPAEDVKLSAEFENGLPQFKVGEPVSRTIYLQASGVLENQLPDIKFAGVQGLKQYPEKPVAETAVKDGQVISMARISNVYIPEHGGNITLPAIQVRWFNTKTGNFETAVIPEYKAVVSGAKSSAQVVGKPETTVPVVGTPIETEAGQVNNGLVTWLLLGAFVLGILVTFGLTKLFSLSASAGGSHKKKVIEAARAKDLRLVRDELLAWAAQQFPRHKITNLQDIADIFNLPAFNKELDKLRETLYADTEGNWDDKTFLEVFGRISKNIKKHKRTINEPLPKLYK